MKRSLFRRMFSVLLAVCIFALTSASVYAQSSNTDCPYIYVPGFMGNDVYSNPGTDNQEKLFPPTTEDIMSLLTKTVTPLTKFVFDRDWDSLGKTLAPMVYELLSPIYNGVDGAPSDNSGPDWTYPEADTLESNGEYEFEYDWRLDPVEIAAQLKSFVDYIKLNTGASQVNIRCHSMGGIVMLCYINLFGYDDINAIMYDTTAIYGETFNGELFTNQIELSDESVYSFMRFAFLGNSYETFWNNFMTALYKLGIINNVCDLGNIILENTYEEVAQVIVPMFAYYPGIWAMIPDEFIPAARNYVFGELLADNGIDYSKLIAKLDNYDVNFRANKAEKLIDSANYMRVGVISRYNFSAIPATKSWYTVTDGTVDSKGSSMGATFADYGETLSEEYVESLSTSKYVCQDRIVDASTALFPDSTWFIKDLPHSRKCSTLDDLTELFFKNEEPLTVTSDSRYPQFMIFDPQSGEAFPLDDDDIKNGKYTGDENTNLFDFIKDFFSKIILSFTSLFKSFGC